MTRNPETVAILKSFLEEYNIIVDEFTVEQVKSGKKLSVMEKVCNDFLQRTSLNVAGLIPLFELYKTEPGMIQPIGLVIRSCLSDFLTFCYLSTFASPLEKSEASLTNELHLLEKDFLNSVLEVSRLEAKISEYNESIPNIFDSREEFEQETLEIKKLFGHLFKSEDAGLRFKKPSEFRQSSLPDYFDSKEEYSSGGSFLTESKKWDRMTRRGFRKYVTVFIGFKFFSQFQHYSKMSIEMIGKRSEEHLFFHLIMALNSITIVSDMQIQIIDGAKSSFLDRLRNLEEKIDGAIED